MRRYKPEMKQGGALLALHPDLRWLLTSEV